MYISHQLVPAFIYDKYLVRETKGAFQGATLFVDLSGFSKMTDDLSRHGQLGAETLAIAMREVFEPLVNAVYSQGGFVVGYVGDAFNAVFPENQLGGEAVMRCFSAARIMREHTQLHPLLSTPLGEFNIRIKVGIGYGETKWQIFKSKDGAHATFWFRGDSVSGAVKAELRAQPSDLILDPVSYSMLKDHVVVSQVSDCYRVKQILLGPLPDVTLPPNPGPLDVLESVFFPESVTGLPTIGEFRQVVNLFVDIPPGISDEALVTPFMETVYHLQEQYGGFFLRPELGDKGFNILLFWGAPTSHENDVERTLDFVMELSRITRLPLRAGITYQNAYTGFIGAPQREDYTAYGWGVNLAARLMEHAVINEVWMDDEIARRIDKKFRVAYLGEKNYKGFAQPRKTYKLIDYKDAAEIFYEGMLVGRSKEMETLAIFVEPLRDHQFAGVMVLKGEAGIGKSRLVHSFRNSNYFDDHHAKWVICQTDEILRESFNPFKVWLKKRFGFIEGKSDEVNWVTFSSLLQELIDHTPDESLSIELSRTSSVLAALINITVPGSLYESMEAKSRYENTLLALSALFRAESLQISLVLFVEDTHWLDKESGAFLSYFVRSLLAEPEKTYPIAIIATQRLEGDSIHMMDEVSMYGIKLGKLSTASIYELAEDILGKPISEELGKLLEERADGNPFFAEQILRYLQEHDVLILGSDGKYSAIPRARNSLPMDVGAVMIARLDRLPRDVRETVLTASVLGREFEVNVLAGMLDQDPKLPEYVQYAQKANIWSPLTDVQHIFRHALLRDAAYSMHLLARRRELHALAVQAMEAVYREDLEPYYGELAYHSEQSGLKADALRYLNLAGDNAMKAFQNQQAVDYFTRALSFISEDDLPARFDVQLKMVECYYNAGDIAAQVKGIAALDAIAQKLHLPLLKAHVNNRRAYLCSAQSDFHGIITYAQEAKRLAMEAGGDAILLKVNLVILNALGRLGNLDEAMQLAKDGIEFARQKGDRRSEAGILTATGLLALETVGPEAAYQYHQDALVIARELKDRVLEGKVLNNIANSIGLAMGDYHASLEYFEKALMIFKEQGDLAGTGIALANMGWISSILGDYSFAANYYEQALVVARQTDNRTDVMYVYVNLAAAAYARGEADAALSWAQKALEASTKVGDQIGVAWAHYSLGLAYLAAQDFSKAAETFLMCIKLRSALKNPILIIEARAGLLDAYLGLSDQPSAEKEAEQIIQYMETDRSFTGAEEPLRIYLSLYTALKESKDPRMQVVLQNANQLLNAQVLKLRSRKARVTFVENVPWRRAISQFAVVNRL